LLTALVKRDLRIDRSCPAVDSPANGLSFIESLLSEPVGDAQRAYAVMANHNDMFLGIEFLMRPRWDISHWNIFAALDPCFFQLPRLANVHQGELLTVLEHSVDLSGADFEVHGMNPALSNWHLAFSHLWSMPVLTNSQAFRGQMLRAKRQVLAS
jgi:hypothetical protein